MFRPAAGRNYNSSTSFSHLKDTLFGKESWVSLYLFVLCLLVVYTL